jgi:N-acetylglucosaminyldiphosphoundecaprenol N-acetyl-beta-D-mannosaminyltransferase
MLDLNSSGDLPRSYVVFGAKVTPMRVRDLIALLEDQIKRKQRCVLAPLNLHALKVASEDAVVRQFYMMPTTYVHIDGMPIVLLCNLVGLRVQRDYRVTCLDYIWPLMRTVKAHGWRSYYVGAEHDVLLNGLKAIKERELGIQIAGHDGFFDQAHDSNDNRALLEEIAEFNPDILLVGMGNGKQERWILENLHSLPNVPICTVGALIEYLAGAAGVPPRWMGRWGIEWCYRLADNPARFWHRYLVEPFTLIPFFYRHYVKGQ